MARVIRDIRLVPIDNPDHQAFGSLKRLETLKLRPTLPMTHRNRLSYTLEEAVQHWLGSQADCVSNPVLAYKKQDHGFGFNDVFRELDAVLYENSTPRCFVEFKSSSNLKPVSKGRKQLHLSLSIARRKWPDIEGCVIMAHFNLDETPLEGVNIRPLQSTYFEQAKEEEKARNPNALPAIFLDAKDVWDYAQANDIEKGNDLWGKLLTEEAEFTDREARRQALREQQVPESEWPYDVFDERHVPPPVKVYETSSPEEPKTTGIGDLIFNARKKLAG